MNGIAKRVKNSSDIKVGTGAFMSSMDKARELAQSIIATAATANLKTHAIITDMNECLGETAGNALEIVMWTCQ